MKTLLIAPNLVRLEKIVLQPTAIVLSLKPVQPRSNCPRCQYPSISIHSRYIRRIADLPWEGIAVRLELHARKFFCRNEECPQRIWCERLPEIAGRYARQTPRLHEALALIGFALGGEAGARIAADLGLSVSPDTLLDRIRQVAARRQEAKPVKILGLDDFAFRRGQRYGTILVDQERHRVIDLLPDREAKTVAGWLDAHPEILTITRDRAPAYAEGATSGAPQAEQVADRWHVLKNLTEVFENLLQQHYGEIRKAVQQVNGRENESEAPVVVPDLERVVPPTDSEYVRSRAAQIRRQDFHAQRKERYEQVKVLQRQGLTIAETAKHLGLSYGKVKRIFESQEYSPIIRSARGGQVDRFEAYLSERWAGGCRNAAELYREISAQGYRGTALTVRRYLLPWRLVERVDRTGTGQAIQIVRPRMKLPSARECVWLLLKEEKDLTEEQVDLRRLLIERNPAIRKGRELIQDFRTVLAAKKAERLDAWMEQARHCDVAGFAGFVARLNRDLSAVRNAVTSPWSNGQVEGQVNRLKAIKRSMYGRANFDLLKARVLNAP